MSRTGSEPELARLYLASIEQVRTEMSKIAQSTAALGARYEGVESRLALVQNSVERLHHHMADCPARGGWSNVREDLSEIRVMVGAHDRLISENTGYRQGKDAARRWKDTPGLGTKLKSLMPNSSSGDVSVSFSIKDPKIWGRIVFYTLVGGAAALGVLTRYW